MICVSLAEPNVEKCLDILHQVDFAEIRLDQMNLIPEAISKIFSSHERLIATFRPTKNVSEQKRKNALLNAISAGAAYVDIETEAEERFKQDLQRKAAAAECRVIFSYHNFELTPNDEILTNLIEDCFAQGADIVKIACRVASPRDNLRLLNLLQDKRPLIVIGLGRAGVVTRIAAPLIGSMFTYAALSPGKETADGQLDVKSLQNIFEKLKNA